MDDDVAAEEQIALQSIFIDEIEQLEPAVVWGARVSRYEFAIMLQPCTGQDEARLFDGLDSLIRVIMRAARTTTAPRDCSSSCPTSIQTTLQRSRSTRFPQPQPHALCRMHCGARPRPLYSQVVVESARGLSDGQCAELKRILADLAGARVARHRETPPRAISHPFSTRPDAPTRCYRRPKNHIRCSGYGCSAPQFWPTPSHPAALLPPRGRQRPRRLLRPCLRPPHCLPWLPPSDRLSLLPRHVPFSSMFWRSEHAGNAARGMSASSTSARSASSSCGATTAISLPAPPVPRTVWRLLQDRARGAC